jgi:sugar O-acyltransferase (sialic acid O-acetyltransferase NeuD family)
MSEFSEMKPIAIFGAGGFGLEVAMLIEQINAQRSQWELIGFFDDAPAGTRIYDLPLLGGMQALNAWGEELAVAFAVGNSQTRQRLVANASNPRLRFPTLIHPSVVLGNPKFLEIGEGGLICAGCILTTHITVGRFVLLNLACTVGHETVIGDFSSFMPTCNISGEVRIGQATFWGTGAKIINRKQVGDRAVIGAGAVVIDDIPAGVTAVGVPAKIVKQAAAGSRS